MRKSDVTYKKISFSYFNYLGHDSHKTSHEISVAQMNRNIDTG